MAVKNAESDLIRMKLDARGFFGLLISNLKSKFKNSKWRIQNCGTKTQKVILMEWNFILGGFWGHWFRIRIQNLKIQNSRYIMADLKRKKKLISMNVDT